MSNRSHPFFVMVAVLGLVLGLAGTALAVPHAGERAKVIVALEDGVNPHVTAHELAARHDGQVGFVYDEVLNGFSIEVPANSVQGIERDRRVRYVEYDQVAHTFEQTIPTGIERIFAPDNANLDIDSTDDYRVDVDVAVIDTGIDLDHPDLNVVANTDCSGGSPFSGSCGTGGDDDNGHGTHVAGTIGAIDDANGVVGVAPGARLHAVKVLRSDGSGYMSWIIAGIDYVTANADTIEVANMSLGCECSSDSLDQAIADSVDKGVAYAVAAGNSSMDVSSYSPAGHPDVLTISALADFDGEKGGNGAPTCRTDEDDTFANFSNYGDGSNGQDVDVIAPGVCILSTVPGGGYDTYSGTSMASPHAAGALGLLASGTNDPTTQAEVEDLYATIEAAGNTGWDSSDDSDSVQERLLDVSDTTVFAPALVAGDGGSGGGTSTNSPPTASFDYSCTDLSCSFTDMSTDSDGTIESWSWDFGDGSTSTAQHPSHTYAADGTYTVTLTVKDDDEATDSSSQDVTVSGSTSTSTGIELSANGYKVKGRWHADLTWSGATTTNVDVYRDGAYLTTTANDGFYTDSTNYVGGGSLTYKVCETGVDPPCSNEVTVAF